MLAKISNKTIKKFLLFVEQNKKQKCKKKKMGRHGTPKISISSSVTTGIYAQPL